MKITKQTIGAMILSSLATVMAAQAVRHEDNAVILEAEPHPHNELWYAKRLAPRYNAVCEVVCDENGARCDLVSPTHAFEVDWAPKWAEGIGQACYYGMRLKRRPSVILLYSGPNDERYVRRCKAVCDRRDIKLHVEPIAAID